ncbi:hypothetical protein V8V91_09790 [Algoriphagus halophilus]
MHPWAPPVRITSFVPKISPLVLDIPAEVDLSDPASLKAELEVEFQKYPGDVCRLL